MVSCLLSDSVVGGQCASATISKDIVAQMTLARLDPVAQMSRKCHANDTANDTDEKGEEVRRAWST